MAQRWGNALVDLLTVPSQFESLVPSRLTVGEEDTKIRRPYRYGIFAS
jgi:hypothetical protein